MAARGADEFDRRGFERESFSIFSVLSPSGGIRPVDRKRSRCALTRDRNFTAYKVADRTGAVPRGNLQHLQHSTPSDQQTHTSAFPRRRGDRLGACRA